MFAIEERNPPGCELHDTIVLDFTGHEPRLELQNTYQQEAVVEARAFGNLVGQSAALISKIDLVAPTEASVLILGETGTGKELVAHETCCWCWKPRIGRSAEPTARRNSWG
jgi:transcriptional regulator with AAA-type ATPase domain